MLKLEVQVNIIDMFLRSRFQECFSGVEKLKDYQAKIRVNPLTVLPVAQSPRRIPFSWREKIEAKLKELQEAGSIEKVQEPTPWVSPVCVVPKPLGDMTVLI